MTFFCVLQVNLYNQCILYCLQVWKEYESNMPVAECLLFVGFSRNPLCPSTLLSGLLKATAAIDYLISSGEAHRSRSSCGRCGYKDQEWDLTMLPAVVIRYVVAYPMIMGNKIDIIHIHHWFLITEFVQEIIFDQFSIYVLSVTLPAICDSMTQANRPDIYFQNRFCVYRIKVLPRMLFVEHRSTPPILLNRGLLSLNWIVYHPF